MKAVFTGPRGVFKVYGMDGDKKIYAFNHDIAKNMCSCNVLKEVTAILKQLGINDRDLALEITRYYPWLGYQIEIFV